MVLIKDVVDDTRGRPVQLDDLAAAAGAGAAAAAAVALVAGAAAVLRLGGHLHPAGAPASRLTQHNQHLILITYA